MNKKILLLPKWYPNKIVPLNGNFIENHAIAISRFNAIAVLFVRPESRNKGPLYEIDVKEEHHFPVIRVYFKKQHGLFKLLTPYHYFMAQRKGYKKVVEMIGKPDLCHIHVMARSGLLALYLKFTEKINFVISEHWTGYTNGRYKGLKKIFTPFLSRRSKGISTVTNYLSGHMKNAGLKPDYTVIPNAIDTEKFIAGKIIENQRIILHISDLKDKHKNISGLLKAVRQLLDIRTDFKVKIIGDGPDKEMLLMLRSELGLEETVAFTGEVSNLEIIKSIRNCSFLSLFSNYETFGVVLIEALACGKPVVASRLPAIEEFINDDLGLLVPAGDEKALCSAFNQMLDKASEYSPELLHEFVKERYSFEAVGKQFTNWYQSNLTNV